MTPPTAHAHAQADVLHVGGLHCASEKGVVERVLGGRPGALAVESTATVPCRTVVVAARAPGS